MLNRLPVSKSKAVFAAAARADDWHLDIDLRVHGTGGKVATVSNPGDVVILDLYAKAFGLNSNLNDDAPSILSGGFQSSNGGLLGDLVGLMPPSPYNMSGSTTGSSSDRDGDGDLDIGGTYGTSDLAKYACRS